MRNLGRWAQEKWLKFPHPLSEKDARDVLWKLCTDGDLDQAYEFVEQMKHWLLHSYMADDRWDHGRALLTWWEGAWIVLMSITVEKREHLQNNKLKRLRRSA